MTHNENALLALAAASLYVIVPRWAYAMRLDADDLCESGHLKFAGRNGDNYQYSITPLGREELKNGN